MRGFHIKVIVMTAALASLASVAQAGTFDLTTVTVAEAEAQGVDGCGIALRLRGNDRDFVYFDNYDNALIRIDGTLIKLDEIPKPNGDQGSGRFKTSDGTIATEETLIFVKTLGDELDSISGTLKVSYHGVVRTFAVDGEGGC